MQQETQKNVGNFIKLIKPTGEQLFDVNNVVVDDDDTRIFKIFLKKQQMMDDVVNTLIDKINVNVLYSKEWGNNKYYNAILYTMPYKDEMFIIRIDSCMYGIINSLDIIAYNSMEDMFYTLRGKYKEAIRNSADISNIQESTEFFKVFN